MADEKMISDLRMRLDEALRRGPGSVARVEGLLKEEYRRLEPILKALRETYLEMDGDAPARQNDVADLRLAAVEAYRPAGILEDFLAGMGVDVTSLMPRYPGDLDVSSERDGKWSLAVVSLKENAMRTLGGHCNVIGNVLVLERRLYDRTYLAAVMKLTDDYEPGKQSYVELDSHTVVFDEDIQAVVEVPFDAGPTPSG